MAHAVAAAAPAGTRASSHLVERDYLVRKTLIVPTAERPVAFVSVRSSARLTALANHHDGLGLVHTDAFWLTVKSLRRRGSPRRVGFDQSMRSYVEASTVRTGHS